jgi:hypothetical protein
VSRMWTFSIRAIVVTVGLSVGASACLAAGDLMSTDEKTVAEEPHEPSWYREQAIKPDTRAIIQQKAQIRAQQRMDRMASLQWYGMSVSRPTGAPTPFTSRYSPLWEMPGGKPFSWYPYTRPGYILYWR